MIEFDDTHHTLERIRSDQSFKGVYGISYIRLLYFNQNVSEELRHKICKEVFSMMPVVIYTQKDFYLLDAINSKIHLLQAAGLNNFWRSQDINFEKLNEKPSKHPKVLTMNHLMGCFHILLFGNSLGFVALILETIVAKTK